MTESEPHEETTKDRGAIPRSSWLSACTVMASPSCLGLEDRRMGLASVVHWTNSTMPALELPKRPEPTRS